MRPPSHATSSRLPRRWSRAGDEAGFASFAFPLLLFVTVVAGIALVDVAAYLVAAARAQQAADAAALAAVSVDVGAGGFDAATEAQRVLVAADARLEACRCRTGSEQAEVTVSVVVPGLLVPSFGAGRVQAVGRAVLAEPP
ncbi:pilus assembly protein TadG-related protein [Egicoccus halophilus]|uniref:Flp pilus-assembly TadE/G-like n=1 Tax=Egicoccus halophilus TaxID=1670830 RepID=A0A8J3A9G7_9ACTN|nr:pilus assembly protein TadG-related protein [Egicoccus halophilus]GGI07706.1 hypothetical protein GCM10011354_25430 [Egicoccus halophilus]